MRHKFFAFCFLIASCNLAKSQTVPSPQKIEKPKTFTIKLQTERKTSKGYLPGINDSLLQLSTKRLTFSDPLVENPAYKTYNYAEVEKVNIRKYGSVGRGIAYGALIGGGVGAVFGLATYQKPNSDVGAVIYQTLFVSRGSNAFMGGVLGAIAGAIIGGIIKSKSKAFFIHRNKEKFNEMKTSVLDMSLNKQARVVKDSSSTIYIPPSID